MFAARHGDIELSRLLLDRGADINASAEDGSTALLVATVRAHVPLARALLERGADPNGNPEVAGYTPLHWAAGKSETFTTFNYPDAPGEWAVLAGIPAKEERLALVKALLSHGADPNARMASQLPRFGVSDNSGHAPIGATPLLLAAFSGDTEAITILVANGGDPFAPASDGSTPLMAAAGMIAQRDETTRVTEAEFLEAVTLLLEVGAPLEDANRRGYRAIHYAAAAGFTTVLRHLVAKGADINAQGANGITPLAVAGGTTNQLYHQRPQAAAVLRELGAK
jgi:ankyrin repeat protein